MTTSTIIRPNIGDIAPDIGVRRAAGGMELRLAELWREGPAVLIFLRYLGCPFCREHAAKIHDALDVFRRYQAKIAFVTVGKEDDMRAFCNDRDLARSVECLSDPDRAAYRAFGLSRGGVAEMFGPQVLARGLQAALHGHFLGMPKGDLFQLPGVFIVDRTGVIRFAHRNKDVADNPPNEALFQVLEALV